MTAKNEPLKTELSNPELLPSHLWAISRRQDRGGNGRVEAHTPLPKRLGGTETVWLTWEDHQQHGLLQSEDFDCLCFWPADVSSWLNTFPPNALELEDLRKKWEIHGATEAGNRAAELGKSGWQRPEVLAKIHAGNKAKGVGIHDPEVQRKAGAKGNQRCVELEVGYTDPAKRAKGHATAKRKGVGIHRKEKCPHCELVTTVGNIKRHILARHPEAP